MEMWLEPSYKATVVCRFRHGAVVETVFQSTAVLQGDWWEMDLAKMEMDFIDGFIYDTPSASTLNGMLGDLFNCSGVVEDGYVLDMEPGKTYLLRVINAALFSEYYLKIAGHKFTVVAADDNYILPYSTEWER
ncbi:Laccase-15 [Dichanthelium oligosanthes]|uniref:Laccase-15 n=1 Tax=Dichanthelium oligosanthes TaxID=888268 RepID=A0A1E5UJ94_9POAL|nr:Laccase-15 [Dichanthelium oligosanthes]